MASVAPGAVVSPSLLQERDTLVDGVVDAALLLRRYGICVLPASAFGEDHRRLRLRVATSLLYGDTDAQRLAALKAGSPCALPWIAASLDRLEQALADLTG